MTVVCIAGMHRSGTSMITHLLNNCGLYLGTSDKIIGANSDNPDGYWEHLDFHDINDQILAEFGGGWDVPPDFPENWVTSKRISSIRRDAKDLIESFKEYPVWGWKDPRNCLVLPFWCSLIKDVKIVVPVRNPLAVYESLNKRGYSTPIFAYRLWLIYQQSVLNEIPKHQRIITHYESYFSDPKAELRRVLDFINLDTQNGVIDKSCELINLGHKHYSPTLADLIATKPEKGVIEQYVSVCTDAGEIYSGIQSKELKQSEEIVFEQQPSISILLLNIQALQMKISEKEQAIQTFSAHLDGVVNGLNAQLAEKEQAYEQLQASIQEYKDWIAHLDGVVNGLNAQLAEKEQAHEQLQASIQEYRDWIAHQDDVINGLKAQWQGAQEWIANRDGLIQQQEAELVWLHSSLSWKIWQGLRRIKRALIPPESRLGRLLDLIRRGLRTWREKGFRSAVAKTIGKLKRYFLRAKTAAIPLSARSAFEQVYLESLKTPLPTQEDLFVPISEQDVDWDQLDVKAIAFYLPQYHPIPENDQWWGKGFTEWTNVSKAVPNFLGHYQPHLPGELGFYDLRVLETQKRQVELARKYGIYGFCFYYYWFGGKRLLERPLNQFLENPELDFPFCVCWANENWTRRWDGAEDEILIGQTHSEDEYQAFIQDLAPVLQDNRYIRVNGKPLLAVYRVNLLPDPQRAAEIWRTECHKLGIGDICLAAVQSFGITDPRPYGFDVAIEFPPHYLGEAEADSGKLQFTNLNFSGRIFDYLAAARLMTQKGVPDYTLYKTVMPSWDNTARRQNDSHIFINSSPKAYKDWLINTVQYTKRNLPESNRFVFINAWNEWAEGTHLEPDKRYGYAYLQATAEAVSPISARRSLVSNWTILFVSHDANKGGSQIVLLNTIAWFREHTTLSLKVLCLEGGTLLSNFQKLADTIVLNELKPGEDQTNQLLDFCGGVPDLIYGNTIVAGKAYQWLSNLGAPIVTHIHEMNMSIQFYGKKWLSDVLKYSTHYLACSRATKDNLIQHYGILPENISIGYAAIFGDLSLKILGEKEKRELKKKLGVVQDKHLIFGCGLGMPFRKGADLFIELGKILRREGRDDFHLYWIGEFDELAADEKHGIWSDYLDVLRQSDLRKFVTFMGYKTNPKEYLQVGDLYVLTSREEPFGLVALEAADCGVPTICFDNAGAAEFVGQDAGYVVHLEDVEAMAQKLISLMDNNPLRQMLGARAREKFHSTFSAEQTTAQILSTCRKVAGKKPGVSIIVPNYNHAPYLPQRLDSIFKQTYQDFEVILLDDASTDNSLELLEKYADRENVQIIKNEQNSGSPFKQWLKGFDLAQADIWWIAESDDISDPEFLKSLLPAFKHPKVKLAYVNSNVINEKDDVMGDYLNSDYLTALSRTKWKLNYRIPAEQEIDEALGVKDTILNVSAVLFRKFEMAPMVRSTLDGMRSSGDWYFIVQAIKGGEVYYDARKLNYHRRHTESVIGKMLASNKVECFYQEMSLVHYAVAENYKLSETFYTKWEQYQRDQWKQFFNDRPFDELKMYYPFDEISKKIVAASEAGKNNASAKPIFSHESYQAAGQ